MGVGKVLYEVVKTGVVRYGPGARKYIDSVVENIPRATAVYYLLNPVRNEDGSINWKASAQPFLDTVYNTPYVNEGERILEVDGTGEQVTVTVDSMGNVTFMPPMWRHDP